MKNRCMPLIVISWLHLLDSSAAVHKEQIRMTILSRNHFESERDSEFECHLSDPDADATIVSSLVLDKPNVHATEKVQERYSKYRFLRYKIDTPSTLDATYGAFACVATKPGKDRTLVTTIWMRSDAVIVPNNELFTQTVSIGDTNVSIDMRIQDFNQAVGTKWLKNDKEAPYNTGERVYVFPGEIQSDDGGVYECVPHSVSVLKAWTRQSGLKAGSGLNILIVRGCPTNRWNPPTCEYFCGVCYNGGICDENSGSCVCPPGFMGTNCSIACGGNRFGYDCEKQCDTDKDQADGCRGLLFCLVHPFGCRCNTGWKGLDCTTPCDKLSYGANCLQLCRCSSQEYCNRYMGCKDLPRLHSAPTSVSKGTTSITIGWIAWDESKDDGDPPVIGYIPYYKEKTTVVWNQAPPVSTESLEFTATDLDPNTYYSFSVAVVIEGGGEGPRSPSLDIAISCEAPNIRPCNVKATVKGYHQDIVNVTWQVPDLENLKCNTGIEYFTIYVTTTTDKQSFKVNDPEARWYSFNSLEPGRYYTFQVTLSTIAGESLLSGATDQSILLLPVLPRLTEAPFFLSISSDSVTIGWVEWNPTRDTGTPTVVAYLPYHKLSYSSEWINGSKILFHKDYEYTFKGLIPGKFYDFSVAAVRDGFGGEGYRSPLAKTKVSKAAKVHPYDTVVVLVFVSAITLILWKRRSITKSSQTNQETSTADLLQTQDQETSTSDLEEESKKEQELESKKELKMKDNTY